MVAAGLAGPSRAAAGSLRDAVLGVTMLSGSGELMHFGGRVIKNVAGYDVSRLVAGSLGILGVIVEVSLKVLPRAESEATLRFDLKPTAALDQLQAWGRRPLPLDASAWWNGNLVVRLRGSSAAVDEARRALGGETIGVDAAAPFWDGLRDHTDPFYVAADDAIEHQDASLWRLSLPADRAAARPGGRRADRVARRAALAGDGVARGAGARRRRGGRRPRDDLSLARQVGRRVRAARATAAGDPRAAEALVRSERHPQSGTPVSGSVTTIA